MVPRLEPARAWLRGCVASLPFPSMGQVEEGGHMRMWYELLTDAGRVLDVGVIQCHNERQNECGVNLCTRHVYA